jgi:hypothetical protein
MRNALMSMAMLGLIGIVASVTAIAQPPSDLASDPTGDPIGDLIETSAPPPAPKVSKPQTRDAYLASLQSRSCPKTEEFVEPERISLKAKKIALQAINPARTSIGGLNFVSGFHLTSDEQRLGGLSGLDVLDDGNLLAVSDKGDFVWIDLKEDGVTPHAARIAAMRDSKGKPFSSKFAGDAEGLAVQGDLALVSFETDPRVLAYNIGACGAAARGIPLGWSMGSAFARQNMRVGDNQGVEGLAVTDDWYLLAGVETKTGKASPLSARPLEAPARFDLAIAENAPELVGLDQLPIGDDIHVFSLHRSSRVMSGNAITVVETVLERHLDQSNLPARVVDEIDERARWDFRIKSSRVLAEMNLLVTIDNYEGISAKAMPDGHIRLFIISDDNFSASQRTLLMVFDVK